MTLTQLFDLSLLGRREAPAMEFEGTLLSLQGRYRTACRGSAFRTSGGGVLAADVAGMHTIGTAVARTSTRGKELPV